MESRLVCDGCNDQMIERADTLEEPLNRSLVKHIDCYDVGFTPNDPLEPSPFARVFVESCPLSPAFIFDRSWDLVAWNTLFERVLGYPDDAQHRGANNLIWRAFTRPIRAMLAENWELVVRRMVAALRTNYAPAVGDESFEALLDALRAFREFELFWADYEMAPWSPVEQFFEHPQVGRIHFASVTSSLVDTPSMTLSMMVAIPGTDAARKYEVLMAGSS